MFIIKERIKFNEMVMSVRRRKKKNEALEIWELMSERRNLESR